MGTPNDYCKGRGRPKALCDDTQRHTILAQSRRLFVQRGYGATKTEDIAAACKISKQTLYRLFPSKPALFAAVVEAARPQWLEFPVPEELPLQQALERIFRIGISDEEDRDRLELARLRLTECPNHPELHQLVTESETNHPLAPLACWMARQEELGRLRLVGDAFSLARMLADMVFGALVMNSFNDFRWPSGEARQTHIRNAISVFLRGVGAPPHAP
ncbi:MAG: helix-turn-helix transcriptional regulator [Rhodospirillales bacterium]|nr:helix-turn-helix transcriptional regulator [Rhodospirillales bacterium]